MLDKITLLSLGIRPDTDPNDPETWSDELKINHKRTLQSLGSRASDIAVKPKGKISGKSGSFKPSTSKNPETGALSGDEIRQESERLKTALSQIDNSDLEKDDVPRGVNATVWNSASDTTKKSIKKYIQSHREFMARHQKNGKLPAQSDLSDSSARGLETLQDHLGDIQSQLGEEAYKRGERHPDPEGNFVVDPTKQKWYQERAVDDHKDELGRVKSAQLLASSYPLGFTELDRVPMGMGYVDFDKLDSPIKVPNIPLKQASSQDLKQEQAAAEAAASVKKPQEISDEELDNMEEMDGYECDTCGKPPIGYDEEEGYQCKSCYKDTHGTSATEDEPEEESSTPIASSGSESMPGIFPIKDNDMPAATHGPYETDIDKIKSQFVITPNSTQRKDGSTDFIATYTNPEVPGHTKLAVSAMVSPNFTGKPNPNSGRLYSINWGGDSVTLANGKNSTKLVGWGTGQFGKGIPTGNRDEEFNLAVHSVAKKIAEYHSKINGKLAGYTAPQVEEEAASETNDGGASTSSGYVSPTYRGFAEHKRALQAIIAEKNTHNKKSSGYAAVDSLWKSVMGEGGAFADTDEEERDRVTGIINQELAKHKKGSIMHASISRIADNLGYDLSSVTPTVQEQNQAQIEAGSNVSAQMTEAAAQSNQEPWQSDDPENRDIAVTIDGKRVPYYEFLKQKTVPIPKISDSQRIMLYTKPAGEPAAPVGFQDPKLSRPKLPAVGSVASRNLPKEQRFAANLRPTNISEDHWNALGDLGQHGKLVRSFVSMYAHKWHSINDGESKYSLDQLKSDRDTITRFFTEKTGGSRESYDGSYLRSYRDLANNISGESNLGKGAYYDKARKSIAKDKETLGKLKSSLGELPNDGFADPKNTRGAYSPVTPEISKGIVDRVLSAYPMPE